VAGEFQGAVHVEGLDGLVNGFGRVDKGLRRELQKHLRDVGKIVAEQAKGVAEYRGLRGEEPSDKHSGQLIARIQPSVRGGSVFIRDSARTKSAKYPGGYNYPARFEFEHGGERSFMRDGLEGSRGRVVREFEKLEDWIATEWGRGA
jgi:hypothetical protein